MRAILFGMDLWSQVSDLPHADRAKYFAANAHGSRASVAENLRVVKNVAQVKSDMTVETDDKEYLPLDVWAQRGFNPDTIKVDCADDTMIRKGMGLCYGLEVCKVSKKRKHGLMVY